MQVMAPDMADESEHLEKLFEQAAKFLRNIVGKLDSDKLLYFYARFKQAKEGPCNVPRPGFFDFQGKQKWDAWNKLGQKNKKDAMLEYINELTRIQPDWEEKSGDLTGEKKSGLGLAVSTMMRDDEDLSDADKTVFDWCKEGNADQLCLLLNRQKQSVNDLDEEGMALLHWACDRGHTEVIQSLVKYNADINIQDADGQTPLHYAVSCEHIPAIEILLSHGAQRHLKDSDGLTPADLSDNSDIIKLLQS